MAFLLIKKVKINSRFRLFFLISFFLLSYQTFYAGEFVENESQSSSLFSSVLRIFCFTCQEENTLENFYEALPSTVTQNTTGKHLLIHNLPHEMIISITYFLNPIDILNFLKTCRSFNYLLDNERYWASYSEFYRFEIWNERPKKSIFAHYYYDTYMYYRASCGRGRKIYITKALSMGHPKAHEIIKILKEKEKKSAKLNTLKQNPSINQMREKKLIR